MHAKTLKALFETAIARQTDIELLIASERLLLLPLSIHVIATGELEVAASDATVRHLPSRAGTSPQAPIPHTRTWILVPSAVQAACIRETPKP
jgi:hypothetical protein